MYTVSRFREGKGRLSRLFFFFFLFYSRGEQGAATCRSNRPFFSLLLTPPPLRIFATLENSRHPPPLRVKIFSFTDSRPIDHFSKSAGFSKSLTVFSFVCFAQGQKKNSRYGSNPYPESLSTSHTFVSS